MSPLVKRTYIEKTYKYHCLKCKCWEWAPADVVDEFADMDVFCDEKYSEEDNKLRKGMPIMVYPNCNADFYYTVKRKKNTHT